MCEGFKSNIRQWPTNQHFANFLQHNILLSALQQDEQAKKVDAFLSTCLDRLNKTFSRWANDFLVCTIGGEAICAKYFVKYMLKLTMKQQQMLLTIWSSMDFPLILICFAVLSRINVSPIPISCNLTTSHSSHLKPCRSFPVVNRSCCHLIQP